MRDYKVIGNFVTLIVLIVSSFARVGYACAHYSECGCSSTGTYDSSPGAINATGAVCVSYVPPGCTYTHIRGDTHCVVTCPDGVSGGGYNNCDFADACAGVDSALGSQCYVKV